MSSTSQGGNTNRETLLPRFWEWTEFGKKSLWDWLDLLIVPAVLAVGALWFNQAQLEQQQDLERARADAALEVEDQRAQDDTLQSYYDQMSVLLIEEGLRGSPEGDVVRGLARARTTSILRRLDEKRKRSVLGFLAQQGLINYYPEESNARPSLGQPKEAVVRLDLADLSGISFKIASGAKLPSVSREVTYLDLYRTDLTDTDWSTVLIAWVNLNETSLRDANLSHTTLAHTFLKSATLSNADLIHAELDHVNLTYANLTRTDLSHATLQDKVNLSSATLTRAKLVNADLVGADLTGADLSYADLRGAEGITDKELEEAASLEGATMPDGRVLKGEDNPDGPTFEDWLKSKDSAEDTENPSAS